MQILSGQQESWFSLLHDVRTKQRSSASPKIMQHEISEVYTVLSKHNALIVHFSGAPKGVGVERENHFYPNDLQHVVQLMAQGGVSCSTVMPSDNFFGLERNATGCIGVILGLQTNKSLVCAAPIDCGSGEDANGIRKCLGHPPNIYQIEQSITNRPAGKYNEWAVRDYIVLGIFAVEPFEITQLASPEFPPDMPDYLIDHTPVPEIMQTNIKEVSKQFSTNRIFGFHDKKLCEWKSQQPNCVLHSEIYTA